MSRINNIIEDISEYFDGVHYVNPVKTGKEAEVHLLRAGSKLYALKIFKQGLKFKSRKEYFASSEIRESRQGRAIRNNSKLGKKLTVSIWSERESLALTSLKEIGVNVPKMFRCGDDYLLMEYIGDEVAPAPQLYRVNLSRDEAIKSFQSVCTDISLMWHNGYVHGDLSAYNILWHRSESVIIDLPQVIIVAANQSAPDKLLLDIDHIASYYRKYDIPNFEEEIYMLKELAWGYWG